MLRVKIFGSLRHRASHRGGGRQGGPRDAGLGMVVVAEIHGVGV